jgi:glycosyltransferase involved in cell wall biosynthesis
VTRPRLTIITPSYNQADFLERTLESVLGEGYENLEYFVVDGGSTDGSVAILERYDDRLSWWVSERDDGQTDALNKGLARATGDIVAYINSDDYYLPGAFDAAVAALEATDALWAVGAARFVDADGRPTEVWWPQLPPKNRIWWLLGPWGVPQAATFWRREVFDRYGGFRRDMHYVFDTEYGLRLAFDGHLPATIDRELAVRVVHPEAKSWNPEDFAREQRRFQTLFRDKLTRRERIALRAAPLVDRSGVPRLLRKAGVLPELQPVAVPPE